MKQDDTKVKKEDKLEKLEDLIAEEKEKQESGNKNQGEKSKGAETVGKQEFNALQELAFQNEEKYKRALADYQNLQRRVQEERSEWIRSGNRELLLRLLPVLDTLMLATKHIQDQGLTVSINHFLDILKSEGVTKIETVGKAFNPHTMECVTVIEGKENEVLEELRAGYMLNERVLRAAQVVVGKGGSA